MFVFCQYILSCPLYTAYVKIDLVLIKNKKYPGFTIVELLIVIVVIGILAAIVIVAYTGVTKKAGNAAIQSNLNIMSKNLAIFNIDNSHYPYGHADLMSMKIKLTETATYQYGMVYCAPATADSYALIARRLGSTANAAYIWKSDGTKTESDTTFGAGSIIGICQNVDPAYVISDISSNFANQ